MDLEPLEPEEASELVSTDTTLWSNAIIVIVTADVAASAAVLLFLLLSLTHHSLNIFQLADMFAAVQDDQRTDGDYPLNKEAKKVPRYNQDLFIWIIYL